MALSFKKWPHFPDIALFLLRIAFGARLIYGTQDNVFSYEHMLKFRDFLEGNDFPFPLVCAFTSVYLQFVGGILWILGWQVRIVSALIALNFIIALLMVHLGGTYLEAAPAIHLLVVALVLMLAGGGKYALGQR